MAASFQDTLIYSLLTAVVYLPTALIFRFVVSRGRAVPVKKARNIATANTIIVFILLIAILLIFGITYKEQFPKTSDAFLWGVISYLILRTGGNE